jgi:hypothetical protein
VTLELLDTLSRCSSAPSTPLPSPPTPPHRPMSLLQLQLHGRPFQSTSHAPQGPELRCPSPTMPREWDDSLSLSTSDGHWQADRSDQVMHPPSAVPSTRLPRRNDCGVIKLSRGHPSNSRRLISHLVQGCMGSAVGTVLTLGMHEDPVGIMERFSIHNDGNNACAETKPKSAYQNEYSERQEGCIFGPD